MVLKTSSGVFGVLFLPVWPWELHILGQYSEIGWEIQLHEYRSEIDFEYVHG